MHTSDTPMDTAPVYEVAIQRTLNSGIHRDHLALSVCVYTLYTLYIVYAPLWRSTFLAPPEDGAEGAACTCATAIGVRQPGLRYYEDLQDLYPMSFESSLCAHARVPSEASPVLRARSREPYRTVCWPNGPSGSGTSTWTPCVWLLASPDIDARG